MDKEKKVCIKRNELTGDCLEWTHVGDEWRATLKEEVADCNPALRKEWENKCKTGKIILRV